MDKNNATVCFPGRYDFQEHALFDPCPFRSDVMLGSMACMECDHNCGIEFDEFSDSEFNVYCNHVRP